MGAVRHSVAVFLILLLLAAACASNPEAAPAASESTTSSPPPPSSTTTSVSAPLAPMTVRGVPPALARLAASIYDHASGIDGSPVEERYLPAAGIAAGMAGRTATGGVSRFGEAQIGLVQAGEDLIAAVDDGSGWRIVAVDLPSLDHRDLGYESAVIAVVGSDARPGEDPLTARADSLHLVALDGEAGTFDLVGIPRDAWVSIPGRSNGKVNSALAHGGPELLKTTLEALTGFPLDGMALTGFEGFQEALGNVLGGVQITLDQDLRDPAAGAEFTAGEQYMNGPQALAFARARKALANGDLDRQRNGGLVLIAAASTFRFRPIEELPALLSQAAEWGWSDLSAETALRLATTVLVAPLFDVGNVVLPGTPGQRGAASTIELTADARTILDDLADGDLSP